MKETRISCDDSSRGHCLINILCCLPVCVSLEHTETNHIKASIVLNPDTHTSLPPVSASLLLAPSSSDATCSGMIRPFCWKSWNTPSSKSWDTSLSSPPPFRKVLESSPRQGEASVEAWLTNYVHNWALVEMDSKLLPAENSGFACRCLPPRWV